MEKLSKIKIVEMEIRDYLYNDKYMNNKMNTDEYYNLIKINEQIWENICIGLIKLKQNNNLYFWKSQINLRKAVVKN